MSLLLSTIIDFVFYPEHPSTVINNYYLSIYLSRALVGFSPRMHGYDIISGAIKYNRWQHTWWSGMYTIILTKAAIMNRQYLYEYDKLLPEMMIKHIDKQRNCEDIAMAYVVALKVR